MAKLNNDRYSADVSADTETNTVTVSINDGGEGPQRSGYVALYYDGPESYGDTPELIDNRRVVAVDWDGVETSVPNVAGGCELTFETSGFFVEGDGEWIVFFGATDDPLTRVHAAEARS